MRLLAATCCAVALLCVGLQTRLARAEDYLGDCQENDALSPDTIVTACKSAIRLRKHEGWGGEGIYRGLYYTAVAEERRGDFKKARTEFLFLINSSPGDDRSWRHFITLSNNIGDPPEQAMAMLDEIVRKTPKDPNTLNGACWARATLNRQLDVALDDCNQALDMQPKWAWILDSRCLVRYRRAEFGLAAGDCDAAIKLEPRMPSSLYVRGLVNIRMGYANLGNADIAAAKAIDPKIAETYAGYGVTP
jgi:tetratricopeptide (TPR) repeat protein